MVWIPKVWQQFSNYNKKNKKPHLRHWRYVKLLRQNMKRFLQARHISCNQYRTPTKTVKILSFPFWEPCVPLNVYSYLSIKCLSVHCFCEDYSYLQSLQAEWWSLLSVQMSLRSWLVSTDACYCAGFQEHWYQPAWLCLWICWKW